MKAAKALIAWTPMRLTTSETRGQVKVGPLLSGGPDWTKPFAFTGGAAYTDRRKLTGLEAAAMVFIDFHTMVLRDGIDPKVAHDALLTIDEFAERMAPDCPGARDGSEG